MAHDVFISYSHRDKAIADAICARLEQDGIRCWYAPRDIEPGTKWASSIIKAVEQTKIMILVFTDASNQSQQVLNEVNAAVTAGTIIVPFRMSDSEPNEDIKYYLSTVHWMDAISEPQEQNIAQLSAMIKNTLAGLSPDKTAGPIPPPVAISKPRGKAGGTPAEPVAEIPAQHGGSSDRPKWLVPAIIAAVIALAAGIWLLVGMNGKNAVTAPTAEVGTQLYVYRDDGDPANHFTQKALMAGSDASLVRDMDEACADSPREGKTCIRCEQTTRDGDWGGWLFLKGYSPEGGGAPRLNDGTTDGQGMDLTGAEALTFWARGKEGEEKVEFFTCGFGRDEWGNATVKFPDSAAKQSMGYVTLSDQWQQYRIDLKGLDMSYIGCGFGYAMSGDQSGASDNVFYLDEICFAGSFEAKK